MDDDIDPRAARSRARITTAAGELLREGGPDAVTFQAVAERAGVGRATVYRHWTDSDALVDEVVDEFSLPYFELPERVDLNWARGQLRRLADELASPATARVALTLFSAAAIGDERAIDRRRRLFGTLTERLAVSVGTDDPDRLLAEVVGPLFFRAVLLQTSVPDDDVDRLARRLITG